MIKADAVAHRRHCRRTARHRGTGADRPQQHRTELNRHNDRPTGKAMTEETVSARRPSFSDIVHAFETMDPDVLAAQMPTSPDTATIVDHYPELATVAVRDTTI